MTPTAITARLLVYMRNLSPERAAELCEIVHEVIEAALAAEKHADVKGMELVSTILKVAAERQRLLLSENPDACHAGCGNPANHTAGGFRWCSSRCELLWLRGRT